MEPKKEVDFVPIIADLAFDRGQQYHAAGDLVKAVHFYRHTLTLADDPVIHEAMMYALVMMRQYQEAIGHCTKAMQDNSPGKRDLAQYNRGLCYLMTGDYLNGFSDYDTRMRMGKTEDILRKKIGMRPMWDGTRCDHLLVYGEQGMGDLFMFCRLIDELVKRNLAKRITFEVPRDMVTFMQFNFPDAEVVPQTETVTPSDEHILLISLARLFGITKKSIPASRLRAEPEMVEKWAPLSKLSGVKIGLCWAGRSEAEQDLQVAEWNSRRSIPLKKLEPLFGVEGVTFISLQKGVDEVQANEYPQIHRPEIKSWSDTAGIMQHLDIVLSIDSGPVHLAGALARPTLLLNHMHTCWRWALQGKKAPWYDTVMVLRQVQEGSWDEPVQAARNILVGSVPQKIAA